MEEKNIISPELQKMLIEERDKLRTFRSNKLSLQAINDVIEKIKIELNQTRDRKNPLNDDQVKIIIAIHFQQGGTARSCDGNTTIYAFDQDIKLATIRKALKLAGHKNSERKLARSLATYIHSVCEVLEIPGNLCNKIARLHPENTYSPSEEAWLSDFQADNKDCPPHLREHINKTFKMGQQKDINKNTNKKTGK